MRPLQDYFYILSQVLSSSLRYHSVSLYLYDLVHSAGGAIDEFSGDAYDFILDVEGYPSSVIYFFVGIGLFILRWRAPQVPRPFKAWWPVPVFFLIGQGFLLVAPFLRPPGGKGDTSLPYWLYPVVGIVVLVCGVLYWFVWRVLFPGVGQFEYVEQKTTLKDGTVVTVFDRVKLKV